MKLIDANVLIAAASIDHAHHQTAAHWLAEARCKSELLGLSSLVAMAFVRITTHPRIHQTPLSTTQAVGWLQTFASSPMARWVHPGDEHLSLLQALLADAGLAGNIVNDAHLAALAREHGATVVSFDPDFQRFPGVRLELLGAG